MQMMTNSLKLIDVTINRWVHLVETSNEAMTELCEHVITCDNIDSYLRGDVITEPVSICWLAGPLDVRVLGKFESVLELDCSNCNLESLEGLKACPLLRSLDCGYNRLKTLEGLKSCPRLRVLRCAYTELVTLAGIEECARLRELDLDCCKVVSLAVLRSCAKLRGLCCIGNNLTNLGGIEDCSLLQTLNCRSNRIRSIDAITNCPQLRHLDLRSNRLVSLEPLVYLRQLRRVFYSDNRLGPQTVQIQRFLERLERPSTTDSIYTDRQNVHNINIQKTVCESVKRLLKDPKPNFDVDSILAVLNKRAAGLVFQYCKDSCVHSLHLLTYAELLAYVWARIDKSEHRSGEMMEQSDRRTDDTESLDTDSKGSELIKILEEQVIASEGVCFTGRFNRLLSVLVGFYEDIVIQISDNSRIGAIIVSIKAKLTTYDSIEHKRLATIALLEAGYDATAIRPWIDEI